MKWEDKQGNIKDIKDLETNHLENILKQLKKRDGKIKIYGCDLDGGYHQDEEEIDESERIEKVELELRLRKIEANVKRIC